MKSSAELCSIDRPVAALDDEYPEGYVDDWHQHHRCQLIYAVKGLITVSTDEGSFVLPPQRALWLPAGMPHTARCRSEVSLRTLYIESDARPGLPDQCRVLAVSELLRALILQAMRIPAWYQEQSRDGRIMQLILDELELMPIEPLVVPMPQDRRLLKVCSGFLREPAQDQDVNEWAESAGMSRRNFSRLFRKETGMSFSAWRQHARLLEALSRLSIGEPVTSVAFDVGYNSSSAFTSMFHRAFGVPPSRYFQAASHRSH